MNTLMKRVAMLGVAGLMTAGAVAPSLAQTVIHEGPYVGARTYHSWGYQDPSPYGGYAYSGSVAAPFVMRAPSQCWTDEGYGRVRPCDSGSVQ